jgi:hypothetical protein
MAKHYLIFIQGLGEQVAEPADPGYTQFWSYLAQTYKQTVGSGFTSEFASIYTNWHTEQLRWVEQAIFAKAFPELINDHSAVNPLRNLTTFFMGDVIAYLSKNVNFVQRTIWQQIWPALKQPLQEGATYSIVAHSLGSVIAFDYLTGLFHTEKPRIFSHEPQLCGCTDMAVSEKDLCLLQERFRHFFTLGSPIGLFMLRQGSLWVEGIPFRAIDNPVRGGDRQWINFYDPEDIIAYPVKSLFRLNPENHDCFLEDIPVQTGLPPLEAHTHYWQNRDIAEKIMSLLLMAD